MAKKYPAGAIHVICCKYRMHDNILSSRQKVVGAKDAIEVVSAFLPDKLAIDGLKYQYVQLTIDYIKEKKFISALVVLLNNGGWWIVLQRIYAKFIRTYNN